MKLKNKYVHGAQLYIYIYIYIYIYRQLHRATFSAVDIHRKYQLAQRKNGGDYCVWSVAMVDCRHTCVLLDVWLLKPGHLPSFYSSVTIHGQCTPGARYRCHSIVLPTDRPTVRFDAVFIEQSIGYRPVRCRFDRPRRLHRMSKLDHIQHQAWLTSHSHKP